MSLTADDRAQINEVLALHGHLTDADADRRLDEVFTHDLVLDTTDLGLAPLRPTDPSRSLEEYIAAGARRGPSSVLAMHVSNVVVTEDDDGTVRSLAKALTVNADGTVTSYTYDDELVRTPEGWRIRHRRISPRRSPGGGIEPRRA